MGNKAPSKELAKDEEEESTAPEWNKEPTKSVDFVLEAALWPTPASSEEGEDSLPEVEPGDLAIVLRLDDKELFRILRFPSNRLTLEEICNNSYYYYF